MSTRTDIGTHGTDAPAREERDRGGRTAIWWRAGYMLLFAVAFSVAQTLHTLIAVVQVLALLVWREPNRHLAEFGASLAEWVRETSAFLTCAADRRPWPFSPWPKPRR